MPTLIHFSDSDGRDLFGRWLDGLADRTAQAKVAARLLRLANSNFGDCRNVGQGVWELRIDWGPGYRVYYAQVGVDVLLLCSGGDKRSQEHDIQAAQHRLLHWISRNSHEPTGKA